MFERIKKFRDAFNEDSTELYLKVVSKIPKLNDKAESSFTAGSIIGMAIGLIVIAAVVPSAIEAFYATNTSTWLIGGVEDTKATTLWWLLPFIAVATVLYMVYKRME